MTRSLTIMMLAGTALFGAAGAASAQDYRYPDYGISNPDATITHQHRGRVHSRAQDGTVEHGTAEHDNGSPPAAGEGRVNSDDQG